MPLHVRWAGEKTFKKGMWGLCNKGDGRLFLKGQLGPSGLRASQTALDCYTGRALCVLEVWLGCSSGEGDPIRG